MKLHGGVGEVLGVPVFIRERHERTNLKKEKLSERYDVTKKVQKSLQKNMG